MTKLQARIIGTGSYLPEKVLSNRDLEEIVETSDEWIFTRTGMKERRIAAENEATSDMGYNAASKALEAAQLKADEIDLILCATLSPDHMFPSTACLIQEKLGAIGCAAVDIQAACSGYVYGLSMAKAYIESGLYKNVLVIASEKLSAFVDYEDRRTCVLFGDGAGACVVSNKGKGLLIHNVTLGADGKQSKLLILPAGGSRAPTSESTIAERQHYIQMEGQEVYKHAVRRMEKASYLAIERSGFQKEQINWLIPHQANIRIIEGLAKRFDISMDHVYVTVHKYGNTSASTIGIALDEMLAEKKLKKDEKILLTAFGAGLTWAASVLSYEE